MFFLYLQGTLDIAQCSATSLKTRTSPGGKVSEKQYPPDSKIRADKRPHCHPPRELKFWRRTHKNICKVQQAREVKR